MCDQNLYVVADIYGILVAGTVHVVLSRLFPHAASTCDQPVYAQDVLDGRVEGYESQGIEEKQGDDSDSKLDGSVT